MRILIVSDAWAPQVNGVVRTLQAVGRALEDMGHELAVIGPDGFPSMACPSYPEIRLAWARGGTLERRIEALAPEAIHIATEGPLGLAARRWCLARGFPFSTAYHTQFPDYVSSRIGVPVDWVWRYIAWFHAPASAVLVSTLSVEHMLRKRGIANIRQWGRGVDTDLFTPDRTTGRTFSAMSRPIQLYVGRVAPEKNIEAFLSTRHPGTRVIVGNGPARAKLEKRFPDAVFLGALSGEPLAAAYADADVLVFPSRTDTFGLVMIEALACGTPVAAFPVQGPADVLTDAVGAMDQDLDRAIAAALTRDRSDCAAFGKSMTWTASAQQFLGALVPCERLRFAA